MPGAPNGLPEILTTKRFEYAQAGIPEYWMVDPRSNTITALRLSDEACQLHDQYGADEIAASAAL